MNRDFLSEKTSAASFHTRSTRGNAPKTACGLGFVENKSSRKKIILRRRQKDETY